jgi:tRNA(fMet)-specific endonuclease VapC
MLDTNIVSDFVRNPRGPVAMRMFSLVDEDLCTSVVVAAELRYGGAKSGSERLLERIEQALERMTILPFEEPADRAYAMIRTDLERRGEPIGANDMLIAAHALSSGCVLVTDNEREFRRVADLTVVNWLR